MLSRQQNLENSMSRPLRFWFWTILSLALFGIGAWRLHGKTGLASGEALLYAGAVAIAIWLVGLRIVVGGRGPLPAKKLKEPTQATPEEFEQLCAAIFEKRGYEVEMTGGGGDYGADVIAKKKGLTLIIGAKRYTGSRKVGNRWVQQLLGAMQHFQADQAILITTSDFTRQAREQAENCPIELIDGHELKKIIRKLWL